MRWLIDNVRNYVFVPSGEAFRGAQLVVLAAVVQVAYKQDLTAVSDWKAWALGLAMAGGNALLAYAYGRVPQRGA